MDAPGGERPPVTEALDAEGDGLVGVTRAKEVAVHGMHKTLRGHRPGGGDEGLGQHLAAEHPVVGLLLGRTQEDVLIRPGSLQLTKVKKGDE
jgi:hypothetical protein